MYFKNISLCLADNFLIHILEAANVPFEHVLFSSNTYKMSETCQNLAFTHPIVVLKSELKNN